MITAIIRSEAGPQALARTLAPLVRGVVEGLVVEVFVVADAGDADSAGVAEACGAALIASASWDEGCVRAAAEAKAQQLLIIDAGVLLSEAFWPELSDRLAGGVDRPLATRSGRGFFARIRAAVSGRPGQDQALVLPRHAVASDPWRMSLRAQAMAAQTFRRPKTR